MNWKRALKVQYVCTGLIVLAIIFDITACSDDKTIHTVNAVDIEVCGHEHDCHPNYDSVWVPCDHPHIEPSDCDSVIINTTITVVDTVIVRLACEHKHCHRKHCEDDDCDD